MGWRVSLLLLLALAAKGARADCDRDSDCKGGRVCAASRCVQRSACARDRDCPGDQVCDRNSCVAPAGASPSPFSPSPSSGGYGGTSREQAAARDAGMALLYTRNTWPENIVDRPLMVAPGMTEIQLNVDKDFSDLSIPGVISQHPLTSELFARFGISDRIHAVLDSAGVCFTDCDPTGLFSFISGYLGYAAVATHDVNLVTQFGFGAFNVADTQGPGSSILATAIPSVLFGWRLGPALQIFSFAAMNLGLLGRDHAFAPDVLALHVEPRFQLAPRLTLAPFIGYNLPLAHPEFYQLPVGVGVYFVADRAVDLGLVFRFLDLLSHNVAPATSATTVDVGGTGARSATASVTFRL